MSRSSRNHRYRPSSSANPRNNRMSLFDNEAPRIKFSEKDICDDVFATIPKLRAAVRHETRGKWVRSDRPVKSGIQLFELTPAGSEDGGDDLDVAHALMAKIRLQCHLNEVVNVLSHRSTASYHETVRALSGNRIVSGRVLHHGKRWHRKHSRALSVESSGEAVDPREPATVTIGVQSLQLRPKLLIKLHPRSHRRRPPTLCFSSCTVRYPGNTHAYHLIKTVPDRIRMQALGPENDVAVAGSLDHLAVGFDIRKCSGEGEAGMITVVAHAYASMVPSAEYNRDDEHPMQMQETNSAVLSSY